MAKRWYIVHAYTNFERKVADAIQERAKQAGLDHLFDEIVVPTEEVVEVRRGRKVQAERKFLPGYVLVKMEMTDPGFLLIKNTPKVTGFLGADNKAVPITDEEAARILMLQTPSLSTLSQRMDDTDVRHEQVTLQHSSIQARFGERLNRKYVARKRLESERRLRDEKYRGRRYRDPKLPRNW